MDALSLILLISSVQFSDDGATLGPAFLMIYEKCFMSD